MPGETYVESVFALLARDKALPKYQFERRVDALFAPFAEDLLTNLLGAEVSAVVAEFPLKRKSDFQSTNVDHLFVTPASGEPRPWIFLELKTDKASVRRSQLAIYREAATKGMVALLAELESIADRSRHRLRYQETIKRCAQRAPVHDCIQLVVFSPVQVPHVADLFPDDGRVVLFQELLELDVQRFPNEWKLFKSLVIEKVLTS